MGIREHMGGGERNRIDDDKDDIVRFVNDSCGTFTIKCPKCEFQASRVYGR
jgi:hypothetical protein